MPVETRRIPLSELSVRPPRQEEFSSVEASMRLDAIASAGAGLNEEGGCVHEGKRPGHTNSSCALEPKPPKCGENVPG